MSNEIDGSQDGILVFPQENNIVVGLIAEGDVTMAWLSPNGARLLAERLTVLAWRSDGIDSAEKIETSVKKLLESEKWEADY